MSDNTTEWIPGDWDLITVGKRVRLVDDGGSIEGIALHVDPDPYPPLPSSVLIKFNGNASTRVYKNGNSTHVFVETPTRPALPTEPFTTIIARYLPAGNVNAKTTHLTLLPASEGNERVAWAYSNGIRVTDDDLPRIQSFVVFAAPVTDTAKTVLGKLDAASMHELKGRDSAHRAIYDENWNEVAAQFGVTPS